MNSYYEAEVHIARQEDGLWRLSVPGLKGGWVDAKTLEEGFAEIQEVIALALDYYRDHGWAVPDSVHLREGYPVKARLPIVPTEYQFSSPLASRTKASR